MLRGAPKYRNVSFKGILTLDTTLHCTAIRSTAKYVSHNQFIGNFCFAGGIRCCELGGVMFGKDPNDVEDGDEFEEDSGELLRLAIPRRTYTESHMKYVYSEKAERILTL